MPYGVLIVTGGMTHQENYALGFQQDSRCRVLAVTDEADVDARRAALNQKLADQLRVPYIRDLGEALNHPGADVVSICTEHHRQGRVAIRCAEAGKHLYVDKPLAGNLDEARRLEEIVNRKQLKTQMFTQVWTAPSQRARRLVAGGQLGEVRAIHCDLLFAKGYAKNLPLARRKENPRPTMFLVPDAKREMFNIGVYSLALARWITGRRAFQSVMSVTGNYFFEENQRRDYEDFGAMAVTMAGGVSLTVSAGRTGWRSHGAGGHIRTKLFGTKSSAFVDAYAGRGEICADGQPQWRSPQTNPEDPMAFWASSDQRKTGGPEWFTPAAPLPSDQSRFIDSLEKGREAEVTVPDGVRVLEVLFAAYRSAATSQLVKL